MHPNLDKDAKELLGAAVVFVVVVVVVVVVAEMAESNFRNLNTAPQSHSMYTYPKVISSNRPYICMRQLVIPPKLVLQGDSGRTWHAAEIEQYAAPLRRRFQRWRSCKAGKDNVINDIIRVRFPKPPHGLLLLGSS